MAARYWLARSYLCCSVLVTAGIGKLDITSQHHDSLSTDGMDGSFSASALLVLGSAGLLDVLLNRNREKPRLVVLWQFRFMIFLGIAAANIALVLGNVLRGPAEPLIARYALEATIGVMIALLDLKARR